MKNIFLILFLFASIPAFGQTLPKTFKTVEGKTIFTNKKVVIIDLFLTGCPHCQEASKGLNRLLTKHSSRLQVVGIALDGNDVNRAKAFQQTFSPVYPIVAGTNDMLINFSPNNRNVPAFIVFKDGKYTRTIIGWTPETEKNLESLIR